MGGVGAIGRALLVIMVALGLAVVLLDSSDDDGARSATTARDPAGLLVITTPPDGSTTRLQRVDPATFAPRGAALDLGEYHDSWAFSPNRERLAVGTFVRTGVRIIDPKRVRLIRDIPTPIAVEGVGWVSSTRLAVLLQRGGIEVRDARSGQTLRRWAGAYRVPCGAQRQSTTPHGVLFLVVSPRGTVRLVRVDAGPGPPRVVQLAAIQAPSTRRTCSAPALAVDPTGQRAVVVGSRGPIAEVNTQSLSVTYHASPALQQAFPVSCARCSGQRVALWPTAGGLVVGGVNVGADGRDTPVGVSLVNTSSWTVQSIDPSAGAVTSAADGALLTFGGDRAGVRRFRSPEAAAWTALPRTRVRAASVAAGHVYVLDDPPRITRILSARTGASVAVLPQGLMRLEILDGRTDSGDVTP